MPTRHKRWTFNSWRLHGRRYIPYAPLLNPTTESYFPTISTDVDHQDQLFNIDNDDDGNSFKILLRLLQFFQKLNREENEKDNGNNQF